MRFELTRIEGRRNDLLLRLDRAEIAAARLSVAHRARLMALPGMPRHRPPSADEAREMAEVKVPIEVFAHEPTIRKMIEQNHGAVERLGNVEKITFVETSLANRAGARGTAMPRRKKMSHIRIILSDGNSNS